MRNIIKPEELLMAYKRGYFPMADSRQGRIQWHSPNPRAIIPLDSVRMHRSFRQYLKKVRLEYRIDSDFGHVIRECANREDCWISDDILESYMLLHKSGYAHSVETWENGRMTGGLYGVAIGGAFFGESMFSKVSNASKAAFYHLVERLRQRKFLLLDSQFINQHTEFLGAIEIPKLMYLSILKVAVNLPVSFID